MRMDFIMVSLNMEPILQSHRIAANNNPAFADTII